VTIVDSEQFVGSIALRGVLQLLVTINVLPSSLIRFTLMMEATRSYQTFVHIQENGILHSHRRKHFRSYTFLERLFVME
jgi:hypothetical protein